MAGLSERSRACRVLVAWVALPIFLAYHGPRTMAEAKAVIRGGVVDLNGHPAAGFRVLVTDRLEGARYMSPPSDTKGEYSLEVAPRGKYVVAGIVAPDGTHFPVQQVASLSISRPGAYRMDIQFEEAPGLPTGALRPSGEASATTPAARGAGRTTPPVAARPWWKSPVGITGIVVAGTVLLVAVANSGGGTASPSAP